jgi:glycosyltransferase involved in cell wall biosynthesis
MIYFDTTKASAARHRSGLTRVSGRLGEELGDAATPVVWDQGWRDQKRRAPLSPGPTDWVLTAELFSPDERPGWAEFLHHKFCRLAAIFHDAIPLQHPHITWPQSVARHPAYMKMLATFDQVFAVSATSRDELLGLWQWQGIGTPPPVEVLGLGADFDGTPRVTSAARPAASLLCLGIIEPRKNQSFLLDACDTLWSEGLAFELHLVGRVNPHFGPPIVAKIETLRRKHGRWLRFHRAASDAEVGKLYHTARASVFPTLAEGCGLPLLESLWRGVPCVHSDLPALAENSHGGGCVPVGVNDLAGWKSALKRILTDDAFHLGLVEAARSRALPTWAQSAATVKRSLKSA